MVGTAMKTVQRRSTRVCNVFRASKSRINNAVAPAFNAHVPAGTPPLVPLLFVTIACGAISGFHGLVGSGTTSKQLRRMGEARTVGYEGGSGPGVSVCDASAIT